MKMFFNAMLGPLFKSAGMLIGVTLAQSTFTGLGDENSGGTGYKTVTLSDQANTIMHATNNSEDGNTYGEESLLLGSDNSDTVVFSVKADGTNAESWDVSGMQVYLFNSVADLTLEDTTVFFKDKDGNIITSSAGTGTTISTEGVADNGTQSVIDLYGNLSLPAVNVAEIEFRADAALGFSNRFAIASISLSNITAPTPNTDPPIYKIAGTTVTNFDLTSSAHERYTAYDASYFNGSAITYEDAEGNAITTPTITYLFDVNETPSNLDDDVVVAGITSDSVPGYYRVTYNITDSGGISAPELSVEVTLADSTAPSFSLANPVLLSWGGNLNASDDDAAGTVTVKHNGLEGSGDIQPNLSSVTVEVLDASDVVLIRDVVDSSSVSGVVSSLTAEQSTVVTIDQADWAVLTNGATYRVQVILEDASGNQQVLANAASFTRDTVTLTLNAVTGGSVKVSGGGMNGSVLSSNSTQSLIVDSDSTILVVATPSTHYGFSAWTDGFTSETVSSFDYVIDEDQTLGANFVQSSYTVTLGIVGEGSFTVSDGSSDVTDSFDTFGRASFVQGTALTLTPVAGAYWSAPSSITVNGVSTNLSGGSYTIASLDENTTLSAVFTNPTYDVTLSGNVNASVSVTNESGADVTGSLSGVAAGTYLTFVATPSDNYTFSKWTVGASEFSSNPLVLPVDEAKSISVEVVRPNYTVVDGSDATFGNIGVLDNANLESIAVNYPSGETVTLVAVAQPGYQFASWDPNTIPAGAVVNGDEMIFSVTESVTVIARFDSVPVAVTLGSFSNGSVTVEQLVGDNPDTVGIVEADYYEAVVFDTTGHVTVNQGSVLRVTATPESAYYYVSNLMGEVQTSPDTNSTSVDAVYSDVTVDEALTINASFQLKPYVVTATSLATAQGEISGLGVKTSGELVTLTAAAKAGYSFVRWSDNVTVSGGDPLQATITVDGQMEVNAYFIDTDSLSAAESAHEATILADLSDPSTRSTDFSAIWGAVDDYVASETSGLYTASELAALSTSPTLSKNGSGGFSLVIVLEESLDLVSFAPLDLSDDSIYQLSVNDGGNIQLDFPIGDEPKAFYKLGYSGLIDPPAADTPAE